MLCAGLDDVRARARVCVCVRVCVTVCVCHIPCVRGYSAPQTQSHSGSVHWTLLPYCLTTQSSYPPVHTHTHTHTHTHEVTTMRVMKQPQLPHAFTHAISDAAQRRLLCDACVSTLCVCVCVCACVCVCLLATRTVIREGNPCGFMIRSGHTPFSLKGKSS